jgi:hypothetical protein
MKSLKEKEIIDYQDDCQTIAKKSCHQLISNGRICIPKSHAESDAKFASKIKRTIHFINRTGELPERFVKDKNEVEFYHTMRLVCEKSEYFINKYSLNAEELIEVVKIVLGRSWKSVNNLYSLRDFLYDFKKRPTREEDPILYKTLYNLENDISCSRLKKNYKKTVDQVLRLAKRFMD